MLKNASLNLLGGVVRITISIVSVPLLIRFLGIESYGIWSWLNALIGLVGLADAGLSVATTVLISRSLAKQHGDHLSGVLTVVSVSMLVLSTIAALALVSFRHTIAASAPIGSGMDMGSLASVIVLFSVVLWIRLNQQICVGVFQALSRFDISNMLMTSYLVFMNIGWIILAANGHSVFALGFYTALVSIPYFLLHLVVTRQILKPYAIKPKWSNAIVRETVTVSSGSWLTAIGTVLFTQVDRLIVGGLLNAQMLGAYSGIASIVTQINTLSALPAQPLIAVVGRTQWEEGDSARMLRKSIRTALIANAGVALLCSGAIVIWAMPLSSWVLQLQWDEVVNGLRLAAIIYGAYSLNAVGYFVLLGLGEVRLASIITLAGGALSLLALAGLTRSFGFMGAIVGNAGYLISLGMLPAAWWRLKRAGR